MGLRHLRLRADSQRMAQVARRRTPHATARPVVNGITEAELKARLAKLSPIELKALAEDPPTKAVLGATVVFNDKQREALDLLRGPAKNVLLHGGARSSKT